MDKNRAKEKLIVVNFKAGSDNYVKLVGGGTIYADDYELWDNGQVGLFYDNRYIARISLRKIKGVF